MRKPKNRKRSAQKQELREEAHQASVKRDPPPERTVFIYSTTAGGRLGND